MEGLYRKLNFPKSFVLIYKIILLITFFFQDRFTASPHHIDRYRKMGLQKANKLWRDWRVKMKAKYIEPLGDDVQAIRQNRPPWIFPADWDHLLHGHFLTAEFGVYAT